MSPHALSESNEGPIGRWPKREVAASSESKRGVTSPGLGVYKVNEAEITRYHEDNGGKGKTGSPPKGAPGVRGPYVIRATPGNSSARSTSDATDGVCQWPLKPFRLGNNWSVLLFTPRGNIDR